MYIENKREREGRTCGSPTRYTIFSKSYFSLYTQANIYIFFGWFGLEPLLWWKKASDLGILPSGGDSWSSRQKVFLSPLFSQQPSLYLFIQENIGQILLLYTGFIVSCSTMERRMHFFFLLFFGQGPRQCYDIRHFFLFGKWPESRHFLYSRRRPTCENAILNGTAKSPVSPILNDVTMWQALFVFFFRRLVKVYATTDKGKVGRWGMCPSVFFLFSYLLWNGPQHSMPFGWNSVDDIRVAPNRKWFEKWLVIIIIVVVVVVIVYGDLSTFIHTLQRTRWPWFIPL